MKLQPLNPVEQAERTVGTPYPARKAGRFSLSRRWVRRIAVAVTASAAFWGAGCLEIGPRLSGDIAYPQYFVCDDGEESWELDYPGSYSSYLCSEGTAWASLPMDEQVTLRFTLESDTALEVEADIIDPSGVVRATASNRGEPVELDLAPGQWTIAVNGAEPSSQFFDLDIEIVE